LNQRPGYHHFQSLERIELFLENKNLPAFIATSILEVKQLISTLKEELEAREISTLQILQTKALYRIISSS
jgi:hypothetical protein